MTNIKFYKPGFLIIGLLLFGASATAIGHHFGFGGEKPSWVMIIYIIGLFIGQGLVLEAGSCKPKDTQEEKNDNGKM